MRIEIFVVKTEIERLKSALTRKDSYLWKHSVEAHLKVLESAKKALIEFFGGLTQTPFKGYCHDLLKDSICVDFGEIWIIYASQPRATFEKFLKEILAHIKQATRQTSQAYAINDEMFFL